MTEQEIIDITNKVFEESFEIEVERLIPEANIFLDLGLDSLDIVDLVVRGGGRDLSEHVRAVAGGRRGIIHQCCLDLDQGRCN